MMAGPSALRPAFAPALSAPLGPSPTLPMRPRDGLRAFSAPAQRRRPPVVFPAGTRAAARATVATSAGLAEAAFNIENVAVLPFWLLMMLMPKSSITQRIMGSYLVFVPLAVIYGILVVSSLAAPGGLDIFTSGSAVTLATLSKAFAEPGTMAAGWAHYVCFDLFVGRWVWADGLRNKVVTAHSLVLGLFFGPLGLLSHLITRSLFSGSGTPKDPLVDGLDDPMSDENLVSLIEDRR